jgi:hypothetical protein
MCNCGTGEQKGVMTRLDEDFMRREALGHAVKIYQILGGPAQIVAAAAEFYNFLNGDLMTSNIDKLEAIADILADD